MDSIRHIILIWDQIKYQLLFTLFSLFIVIFIQVEDEEEREEENFSELSMTYVPSENQSLAQLIPDEGVTFEINPEVKIIHYL